MTNIVLSSVLQPKYLTNDYKKHLLNIYKKKYETSGNDLGYIVKINNP